MLFNIWSDYQWALIRIHAECCATTFSEPGLSYAFWAKLSGNWTCNPIDIRLRMPCLRGESNYISLLSISWFVLCRFEWLPTVRLFHAWPAFNALSPRHNPFTICVAAETSTTSNYSMDIVKAGWPLVSNYIVLAVSPTVGPPILVGTAIRLCLFATTLVLRNIRTL